MIPKRVLIVGGVAGGASCAARLRRLCEKCEIVVFDKGPYVSFANCGLPYYVGNVIRDEEKLLVASPELFAQRFHIDVRVLHAVIAIDRAAGEIVVKNVMTGEEIREAYEALVLSPGSNAIRPPIPGIELPGIFVLRTIPDSREIRSWIEKKNVRRAIVVGGGFIGLEMAENLHRRGIHVSIVELSDQLMPPFDPEMARPVEDAVRAAGVDVFLGDGVERFESVSGGLAAATRAGRYIQAEMVILAIGVRPETTLAREAGLEIGASGGIRVDTGMRTSDPKIWAVGDAVEVRDIVTRRTLALPLAGPANRQGRIAADVICGRDARFRGVQGTAVCGAFGVTAAITGASEKSLRRAEISGFDQIHLHPGHHVGYYPGAQPIHMKLIFNAEDGRIMGAQAVGAEGVEKRIDVIATAIQLHASVFDIEEAELCYAPQFGAAKDPVNIAGMIASNIIRGDLPISEWRSVPQKLADGSVLLDVREADEFASDHAPCSINIPLSQLRERMKELPRDRDILVCCYVGHRAYYAVRALLENGFPARHLPGGLSTWRAMSEKI